MQKLGSGKATVEERHKPMFSLPIFKREKRPCKNNIAVFFAAAAAITAMFGGFIAGHGIGICIIAASRPESHGEKPTETIMDGIMLTFYGALLAVAMVNLMRAFLVMHLSVTNAEATDENVTPRPPRLLRTKTTGVEQ